MRVRRAHDHRVELTRQVDVIRIAPRALDEPWIFDATSGLTDAELFEDDVFGSHGAAVYETSAEAATLRLE